MKQILTFLLLLQVCSFTFSQNEIRKVEMYVMIWNTKSRIPITPDNIGKYYDCKLIFKGNGLFYMTSYSDFHDLLTEHDTTTIKNNLCFAEIIIHFKCRKIKVYFNYKGAYFYKGEWYEPDYNLFYSFFYMFRDNYMVPKETLDKSQKNLMFRL